MKIAGTVPAQPATQELPNQIASKVEAETIGTEEPKQQEALTAKQRKNQKKKQQKKKKRDEKKNAGETESKLDGEEQKKNDVDAVANGSNNADSVMNDIITHLNQ